MSKHITQSDLKAKMDRLNIQSALQSASEDAMQLLDDILAGSIYEGQPAESQDLIFVALQLVETIAEYRLSCEPQNETPYKKPDGPSQAERL